MNHLPDPITIQPLPDVSENETIDGSEPDAEEEIDQLDSDSDAPPNPRPDAPIPKKSSKHSERRPGQTYIPAVRIENILQADGVLGNLNISKEGVFLLSIATEEFIKHIVKAGHQRASEQSRAMVRYNDMAAATRAHYELKFLQETIPMPKTLASALALRSRREQELVQNDPAMQFQNGHTRPQRRSELLHAMLTPTTSTSSVLIHESLDGPQCLKPPLGPALHGGLVPNWRPPSLPNADTEEESPSKKRLQCVQRSYTPGLSNRPQSRKNGTLIPQNSYPNPPSASTSAINEPSQTWEEWKEKSRRLYRTGDDLRRRSSPSNVSQQPSAPLESSIEDPLHPLPPISQWEKAQTLVNHTHYPEGHRSNSFDYQSMHPSASGNPIDPQVQPDLSHEKPTTYLQAQEPWMGPLTGPGSAFLQGPGGPFPRPSPPTASIPPLVVGPVTPAEAASGRTIHSLDDSAD